MLDTTSETKTEAESSTNPMFYAIMFILTSVVLAPFGAFRTMTPTLVTDYGRGGSVRADYITQALMDWRMGVCGPVIQGNYGIFVTLCLCYILVLVVAILPVRGYRLLSWYGPVYLPIHGYAIYTPTILCRAEFPVLTYKGIGTCFSAFAVLFYALCRWMPVVQTDFKSTIYCLDAVSINMNSKFLHICSSLYKRREAGARTYMRCGTTDVGPYGCRTLHRYDPTYHGNYCHFFVLYMWIAYVMFTAPVSEYIDYSVLIPKSTCLPSSYGPANQLMYGSVTMSPYPVHMWTLVVQGSRRHWFCGSDTITSHMNISPTHRQNNMHICIKVYDGSTNEYPCKTWCYLTVEFSGLYTNVVEHKWPVATPRCSVKRSGPLCVLWIIECSGYYGHRHAHQVLILCLPGSVRFVRVRSLAPTRYCSFCPVVSACNGKYSRAGLAQKPHGCLAWTDQAIDGNPSTRDGHIYFVGLSASSPGCLSQVQSE